MTPSTYQIFGLSLPSNCSYKSLGLVLHCYVDDGRMNVVAQPLPAKE